MRFAREVIARLNWVPRRRPAPQASRRATTAEELLGIMPTDRKRPVDMREVIARFADDSDFLDFKPGLRPGDRVRPRAVQGFRSASSPTTARSIRPAPPRRRISSRPAARPGLPILYLQNTTGYIVGKASEEAGMIKHGSKMIQAVSNANVPQITLMCGASFGAGNYGMCGRAYNPRFLFSWPNAQTAVMGAEQAALTMANVMEAGARRERAQAPNGADRRAEGEDRRQFREPEQRVRHLRAHARRRHHRSARHARRARRGSLSICRESETRSLRRVQFAVARP